MMSVIPPGRTGVRIVVAGDQGTGKSTLIRAVSTGEYYENVDLVLPPTRLDVDTYPDRVPVTIIDTSFTSDRLDEELLGADAIVLTCAYDSPQTFERLNTFWLPRLHNLQVDAPVVVAVCKSDLRPEDNRACQDLDQVLVSMVQQSSQIEHIDDCSPYQPITKVEKIFYKAQQTVLHPRAPLFDHPNRTLKPRCIRALKRIFKLLDSDNNGALDDDELNQFQVTCFNSSVQPSELVGLRRTVQNISPEGVNEYGLTLRGFEILFVRLIINGRLATVWTVLRKFGYNDSIELVDELVPPLKCTSDQSVELTDEANDFLTKIFNSFDTDRDGMLQLHDLEELFSTAPESPWIGNLYEDAVERNAFGGLSLDAFLSEWALMTLLNPTLALKHLLYIGYAGDLLSAVCVTRKRCIDRKEQRSERNVFQCFIFGPTNAGKSAILNSFIRRPFSEVHNPTNEDRYAVNVDLYRGNRKYLVLKEIAVGGVERLMADKESLASCDIAVFVYDRSDWPSWVASRDLLEQIAGHGERTGFELPCFIFAAKDDLEPSELAIQDSTTVSQEMGVDHPISISMMLRNFNGLFDRIVNAAEHPHLSIPETEAGRNRWQLNKLVSLSAVCVSVAVAIIGAYREYAATKSASG